MTIKLDILIVGGGLAGLGAAIPLADSGHTVTVLERNATLQNIGGQIGLGPTALRLFDSYGILEDVRRECGPPRKTMYNRRWQDGSVLMHMEPQDLKERFGYGMQGARRTIYHQHLFEAAKKRGVVIRFCASVESVDENCPSVTLSNGETIKADLLIGADGIKSKLRNVLNPKEQHLYSGMDDYMMTVPSSTIKSNPKLSHVAETQNFWWGPGGCAVTGVSGAEGSQQFYMEFCNFGDQGHAGQWNQKADLDKIREYFKSWDPVLSEMLQYPTEAKIWRLAYTSPELDWVNEKGNIVLIGDAAHTLLPITGAGATASLEDGATLSMCLSRLSPPRSSTPTTKSLLAPYLQAFATIRKPRLTYLQAEGLHRFQTFHLPDGPDQVARDMRFKSASNMLPPTPPGEGPMGSNNRYMYNPPDSLTSPLSRVYLYGFDLDGYVSLAPPIPFKSNLPVWPTSFSSSL